MYDAMVTDADCTMTIDDQSLLPDGNTYNDCGGYYTSCVFFVLFQVQFEAFNMYCIMQIVISSIPRKS